jgi:hypothetical protein
MGKMVNNIKLLSFTICCTFFATYEGSYHTIKPSFSCDERLLVFDQKSDIQGKPLSALLHSSLNGQPDALKNFPQTLFDGLSDYQEKIGFMVTKSTSGELTWRFMIPTFNNPSEEGFGVPFDPSQLRALPGIIFETLSKHPVSNQPYPADPHVDLHLLDTSAMGAEIQELLAAGGSVAMLVLEFGQDSLKSKVALIRISHDNIEDVHEDYYLDDGSQQHHMDTACFVRNSTVDENSSEVQEEVKQLEDNKQSEQSFSLEDQVEKIFERLHWSESNLRAQVIKQARALVDTRSQEGIHSFCIHRFPTKTIEDSRIGFTWSGMNWNRFTQLLSDNQWSEAVLETAKNPENFPGRQFHATEVFDIVSVDSAVALKLSATGFYGNL